MKGVIEHELCCWLEFRLPSGEIIILDQWTHAVDCRTDLVATQRRCALSPLTLDFIGVVDQNIPVGTVVRVAVDFLRGVRQLAIGDGLRPPLVLTVVFQV